MISKSLIINWPNSIIRMLIKDSKADSKRFLKLMKYCQMIRLKSNTIPHEFSEKDGQRWVQKLNKDHTLMRNTKMYFIACQHKKDNNSKDKLKQD